MRRWCFTTNNTTTGSGACKLLVMAVLLCTRAFCDEKFTMTTNDGITRNLLTIVVECGTTDKFETEHKVGNSNVILLGFLSPRMNFENFLVGALPLAVFHLNENRTIGDDYQIKFCSAESGPSGQSVAMRHMTMMKSHGVQAFLGPDESCMSEAMLANAWDLPMISYKCSDKRVSNKKVFPTFARTMPPSSKISKFVVALLKHYQWAHIVILVGKKPSWIQMVEALEDLAKENKIKVTEKYYMPEDYTSYSEEHQKAMKHIVDITYTKTRVYVFVGENGALIDFARHMHKQGILSKGEYVIISVDDETSHKGAGEECLYVLHAHEDSSTLNESTVQPFRSVLKLTPSPSTDPNFAYFQDTVRTLSTKYPFYVPIPPIPEVHVPMSAANLYDAVYVYATAVAKVVEEGGDVYNVTQVMSKIFNSTYKSVQGFDVRIDENGDAEGNYTVLGLVYNSSLKYEYSMKQVAWFTPGHHLPSYVKGENDVKWINGIPPRDEPDCGFDDSKCGAIDWKTIVIVTVVVLVAVATIFIFRHYRYEQKLACLLWKIDLKDIIPITTCELQNNLSKNGTQTTKSFRGSFFGYLPNDTANDYALQIKPYTEMGNYKGTMVAIKTVKPRYIDLTRNIRKELKQIRELRHDNINTFIGAFIDHQNIGIVTTYCARGSLEDVLKNKDLRLDNMFVATLVADLMRGMIYLHDSEIMYHGSLKSSNCLVDSRWVLQIADFGLHEFKASHEPKNGSQTVDKSLLWRAPELLREPMATTLLPTQGTQKGDVYSFGLIMYHVVTRKAPWQHVFKAISNSEEAIQHILQRIKNPDANGGLCLRPPTNGLVCQEPVVRCMQECWSENPDLRPDFRTIRTNLKGLQAGLKANIFDNMMSIMEKYALNLEGIVQSRTQQLMEEKKKTETLLHRMLPKSVAESLKRRGTVEAETFDMVTIYFSDIVGFTLLSASSTPMQVVTLLNDLYTCFDKIIGHFGVYKIETIGDAYMVVSGLPIRNGDNHAKEIASMAMALVNKIKNFKIMHRPGETLKLRIGIHSGPCVAGVVGLKMPRYCLFGDTVNTASRMESTGEALKIHVSQACKNILDKLGGFILEERGFISVKGKGEMRTFWLLGKEAGEEHLPSPHLHASQCDLLLDDSGVYTATTDDSSGAVSSDNRVQSKNVRANKSESLNRLSLTNNNNHLSANMLDSMTDDYETTPSPSGSLPSSPLLPSKSRLNNNNNNHKQLLTRTDVECGLNSSSGSISKSFSPQSIVNNVASKVKKYANGGFVSCSDAFLQPEVVVTEKKLKKCENKIAKRRFDVRNADSSYSAPTISYKS